MEPEFQWAASKNRTNLEKHGISFSEAVSVFSDPLARIFADEDHSSDERREIIIGHTRTKQLVLVCFTELEEGRVRIFSARHATRTEQHDYEENVTP